jgi:putative ABC transport system permease protein
MAVGDVYQGRPIIGTLPKMFQSLPGLARQIDQLLQQQVALTNEAKVNAKQVPTDLAKRQAALATAIEQIKQQIVAADVASNPIVEPKASDASPSKWQYGNPASQGCDAARQELSAAAEALASGNVPMAIEHQNKGYDLLHGVYEAASAVSGPLEYVPGKHLELADGRVFHAWKFEAVIGDEVARKTGLKIGDKFQATYGATVAGVAGETHPEKWEVVGILKPTHTAADRCLYIPLISFYSIAEHGSGLEEQAKARSGQTPKGVDTETKQYKLVYGDQLLPDLPHTLDFISLDVPPADWSVSAIMIQARGDVLGQDLIYFIANGGIPDVQSVNPAQVMQVFFHTFLKSSAQILLLISFLVSIVAAVGILVSIYNSVAARTREIAILRALGATRGRVLTLICAEAALIGLIGSILGVVVGHGIGGVVSAYMDAFIGQGFDWLPLRLDEVGYVATVVFIALLAGLVPAMKAYKTPVATNLVAA